MVSPCADHPGQRRTGGKGRHQPSCSAIHLTSFKFQQETLASQIRYYKTRHQQQRVFIERLKREAAEVKKVNEVLDSENYQLRQLLGSSQQSSLGYSIQQPSDIMNSNGKRPMVDARLRPQTHSSPLSISSVGPNRLTLPPGQVAPNLLSNRRGEQDDRPPSENVHHSTRPPTQRQAGTFTEHYSYVPPSTPRLTQTHAAPRSLQQTRPNQEQQHYIQAPQALDPHGQHAVPTPAKFKPAKVTSASNNKPSPFDPHSQIHTHRHSGQQQGDMGPPPTPLHARRKQSASTAIHINHGNPHSASTSESLQAPPINTHPRINRVVPLNPIPAFLPQSQSQTTTPSTGISQRFMLPSAKASPRIVPFNMSGGNQRIPFVPGSRGGFT
ncbi:hypothetical protein L208DRAFT_240017 [Tricholoma matsutake]|nr:hypothetical protein L208DRAFT_240017 [Tricholoma matsutake 945]